MCDHLPQARSHQGDLKETPWTLLEMRSGRTHRAHDLPVVRYPVDPAAGALLLQRTPAFALSVEEAEAHGPVAGMHCLFI